MYIKVIVSPTSLKVIVVFDPAKAAGVKVTSPPSVIIVIIFICPTPPAARVTAYAPVLASVVTGVVKFTAPVEVVLVVYYQMPTM